MSEAQIFFSGGKAPTGVASCVSFRDLEGRVGRGSDAPESHGENIIHTPPSFLSSYEMGSLQRQEGMVGGSPKPGLEGRVVGPCQKFLAPSRLLLLSING